MKMTTTKKRRAVANLIVKLGLGSGFRAGRATVAPLRASGDGDAALPRLRLLPGGGAIMFDVNRRFNMSQWQLCFDRAVGDKIELLVIWQRWVMITAMNYVSIAGGLTF